MFNFYTRNLKKDKRDDSLCLNVVISENGLSAGVSFSKDMFSFKVDSYLDTYGGDFELLFNKCDVLIVEREYVPGMKSCRIRFTHPTKGRLGIDDDFGFYISLSDKNFLFLHKSGDNTLSVLEIREKIYLIDRVGIETISSYLEKFSSPINIYKTIYGHIKLLQTKELTISNLKTTYKK